MTDQGLQQDQHLQHLEISARAITMSAEFIEALRIKLTDVIADRDSYRATLRQVRALVNKWQRDGRNESMVAELAAALGMTSPGEIAP